MSRPTPPPVTGSAPRVGGWVWWRKHHTRAKVHEVFAEGLRIKPERSTLKHVFNDVRYSACYPCAGPEDPQRTP